jgi:hypothetical protein
MFSIMRVPNPRCVGGVMIGPPDSVQRKLSRPSVVRDHAISTSPSAGGRTPTASPRLWPKSSSQQACADAEDESGWFVSSPLPLNAYSAYGCSI